MREIELLRKIGKAVEDLLQHYENWEKWAKDQKTNNPVNSPIFCDECNNSEWNMIHSVADWIKLRNDRTIAK